MNYTSILQRPLFFWLSGGAPGCPVSVCFALGSTAASYAAGSTARVGCLADLTVQQGFFYSRKFVFEKADRTFGDSCTVGNTVFAERRYHRKNGTAEIHGLHVKTVSGRERTFDRFLQNPPGCPGILFFLSRRKAFRKMFQKTFRHKKDRKEGRQETTE